MIKLAAASGTGERRRSFAIHTLALALQGFREQEASGQAAGLRAEKQCHLCLGSLHSGSAQGQADTCCRPLIRDRAGWYYKRATRHKPLAGMCKAGWTLGARAGGVSAPSPPRRRERSPARFPGKALQTQRSGTAKGAQAPGQAMSGTAVPGLPSPSSKSRTPVHPPAATAPPIPFAPQTLRLFCIAARAGSGAAEFGQCLSAGLDSEEFTQGWAYL